MPFERHGGNAKTDKGKVGGSRDTCRAVSIAADIEDDEREDKSVFLFREKRPNTRRMDQTSSRVKDEGGEGDRKRDHLSRALVNVIVDDIRKQDECLHAKQS